MFQYIILGSSTIICLILFIYIVIRLITEDLQANMIARQRTRRNRIAREEFSNAIRINITIN